MKSPRRRTSAAGWAGPSITILAALVVVAVGIRKGTFSAGDSDPYGYVSEADLIAHGSLRIEQQFARSMPWPLAESTFAPIGYRPAPTRGFIVPTYAPGLPMVMAAFQRIGGRSAVFYVVPVLGALAVLMTAWLGTRIYSRLAGVCAAVLLASSPSFLHQVVEPVSDVPAAAWWTTSLALAVQPGSVGSFAAGAAASMAILTRPNLVPLAAVIGVFFIRRAVGADRNVRRAALRHLLLFFAGVLPGCFAVAGINQHLYGSPIESGYGRLNELYTLSNAWPNLDRYPRWMVQTQTPFVCLGLLAPWLALRQSRRPAESARLQFDDSSLLLGFFITVFISYLFYNPFDRENWGYLRFLLPGYPPLIVLSVAVAFEALQSIPMGRQRSLLVTAALCACLTAWEAREAVRRGAFHTQIAERRYVDVGQYISAAMPRDAVFISGLHAGSIRYYSNRLTVRYDLLAPRWLETAVGALRAKGYRPYLVLEEGEEPIFRERFAAFSDLARLDWPPAVQRSEPIRVRIYDPADRARFLAGEAIATGDIGLVARPIVTRP